jgi:hypothetical protein
VPWLAVWGRNPRRSWGFAAKSRRGRAAVAGGLCGIGGSGVRQVVRRMRPLQACRICGGVWPRGHAADGGPCRSG